MLTSTLNKTESKLVKLTIDGYFSKKRKNLSHICNFYHSTHRSVLVPSICKFLATVKGKEETKTVKAAGIAVESFQESAFRMCGS